MPFRVASLNIWNRMGPWDQRLTTIRAGVTALNPDILGLQEVVQIKDAPANAPGPKSSADPFDQAALIAEGFGYHVAFGRNSESKYPMGNAILSRWPILSTHVFPLPRVETDEYRSLLFAEIEAPFGILPVFCTHLNWKLHEGHVREVQIRYITDQIRGLCPMDSFPPLLLGDMNAEPGSDEMRFLRGLTSLGQTSVYFADTFGITNRGDPGFTFARKNPFATVLREPDRRIDYVFVRGPDETGRGEPLDAKVCFDEPHDGIFASDHFGVVATISTE